MGFKQCAVPGGILGAGREWHRAIGGSSGGQILVVRAVKVHGGEVKLFDEELADQPSAVKALVAYSGSRHTVGNCLIDRGTGVPVNSNLSGGGLIELKIGRGLADISKCADALQAEASDLKGLADGEEAVIGATGGQPRLTVICTQKRGGITGAVILGVPHHFHAHLVVANPKTKLRKSEVETVVLGGGRKVIVGINAGNAGEGENALFGQQIVEFKFAKLDVKPAGAGQIVKPRKNSFKVKCTGVVRGRQDIKGDVFCQRAAGVEIKSAPIESVNGYIALNLPPAGTGRIVDRGKIGILAVPNGRDAESDRPIGRTLENGGIAVVAHLIAVVLEGLSKGTQHRPSHMAGGAGHAVFPREGWEGVHLNGRERRG